jgi:3-phenylpropionate/trans-cinnamate dioxygenase ferredoxin reductase subunit
MSSRSEHVVVVGAGLAGLRTAEHLRAGGHRGPITLIGAEPSLPYDRPPLSKQALTGTWQPGGATLADRARLDQLGLRLRLGVAATGLEATTVALSDGNQVRGDAVVLATGVNARRLPGQPGGTYTLRTLEDALALRDALARARSLLIIGAGFVGAEVASAARARGLQVTMLEALPVPLTRALGHAAGRLCARLISENGVDLRCGVPLERFVDHHTVILGDGTTASADVVLVGIGGAPELSWLDGSGLDTGNGIVCDATGRVRGGPGLWAVGDVAAWECPVRGGCPRDEHWTSAADQAAAAARDILGAESPRGAVPYFWSDQFGLKIQLAGWPELADDVRPLHGDGLNGGPVKGTVLGYFAGDGLVAVAAFGAPGRLARYRAHMSSRADYDTTLSLGVKLTPA